MDINEVKNVIASSRLKQASKDKLLKVLPLLAPISLTGLGREASRGDAALAEDFIVFLWEKSAQVFQLIKGGEVQPARDLFWKLFEKYVSVVNEEDRAMFLYLVMDIRRLSAGRRFSVSEAEYKKLLDYEVELLTHLPPDELQYFISSHLVMLGERFNLVLIMQMHAIDNLLENDDDFFRNCTTALLGNSSTEDAIQDKTIAQWLKEFSASAQGPASKMNTLSLTDFFVKHPKASRLPPDEKNYLREVCKLYLWFLNPVFNDDEVLEYRAQLEKEKADRLLKEYELQVRQAEAMQPQVIPAVKPVLEPAPDLRPKAAPFQPDVGKGLNWGNVSPQPVRKLPPVPPRPSVDIEKKLAELKSKAQKRSK